MATWEELSLDCLAAAKNLADESHWRSSVSRSYYAAYSAVTSRLVERGVSFPHGRNNPGHEQLPNLVLHNLTLPMGMRQHLRSLIRFLREARETADYRPGQTIDEAKAVACLRRAEKVLKYLEVQK
jgi:uncharacterized protein (UPF0332 family)